MRAPLPTAVLLLAVLATAACASHHGYRTHATAGLPEEELAYLVHVPQPYPVVIVGLDGRFTRGALETSSKVPTYIEIPPGRHHLFLEMGYSRGALRGCDNPIRMLRPAVIELEAEPGGKYLLQRRGNMSPFAQCSLHGSKFQVEFFVEELPPAQMGALRDSFERLDLDALPWYAAGDDQDLRRIVERHRGHARDGAD